MTVLYEQSDFASPDETIIEYRHRTHPVAEHAFRVLIPLGIVGVILLAFVAAALIASVGP